MNRKIIYIIFLLLASHLEAQVNLVPNPSFETYTSCPTGSSQLSLAIPWLGVTTNSSDYFNVCGSGGTNVPNGGGGAFQYSRTGNAYGGIWAINGYGGDYREYLRVKLDSTLMFDSCYYVEFYCNLNNLSRYGIDKMGVYISNTAVSTVGPSTWGLILQYTPQIISNSSLDDTLNWMRISGYYHALGGEKYITIGNFSDDSTSDTTHVGGSNYNGSYYYIDDVSVKKVVGCDTTAGIQEISNTTSFNLFPNPNDGNMTLQYTLKQSEKGVIRIYDVTGKLVNEVILNSNENQMQIVTDLDKGIYLYQVVVNDKIVKSDKLVIIR